MMKYILLSAVLIFTFSCGGKEVKSDGFLYGSKLYENFVSYYLSGKAKLADRAFADAEKQFLKMDGICNISRLYIARKMLDESGDESASLTRALEYAELGGCKEEKAMVAYLQGGSFDVDDLPKKYRKEIEADDAALKELSTAEGVSDYYKTRLLRKAAIMVLKNNPEKAEVYAQAALDIDKFNGWSLNIMRDLIIMKDSLQAQGKDIEKIKKRIELIKLSVIKK